MTTGLRPHASPSDKTKHRKSYSHQCRLETHECKHLISLLSEQPGTQIGHGPTKVGLQGRHIGTQDGFHVLKILLCCYFGPADWWEMFHEDSDFLCYKHPFQLQVEVVAFDFGIDIYSTSLNNRSTWQIAGGSNTHL